MPYIDSEILEKLIATMVDGFARIEKKLERMNRQKECLDGDTLLDNVDLAELLGQEFLSRFRDTGVPETAWKMTFGMELPYLLLLFILVAIGR